jgi:hypothetical protein
MKEAKPRTREEDMSEHTKRVLELLASGKITVEEADRLLQAIGNAADTPAPEAPPVEKPPARYLRIQMNKRVNGVEFGKQVNIRVPLALVKSGMRLGAMIPGYGDAISAHLHKQGIDLDLAKLNAVNLEAALRSVGELGIDMDEGRSKVKISCE